MKIPFLLVILSAAFAKNASNGENPFAIQNATKNSTENVPLIHCKNCPYRTPPTIMKGFCLQNYAVQSAEFSKACLGFLFLIVL